MAARQQVLGRLQICRLQAFGEPAVDLLSRFRVTLECDTSTLVLHPGVAPHSKAPFAVFCWAAAPGEPVAGPPARFGFHFRLIVTLSIVPVNLLLGRL